MPQFHNFAFKAILYLVSATISSNFCEYLVCHNFTYTVYILHPKIMAGLS